MKGSNANGRTAAPGTLAGAALAVVVTVGFVLAMGATPYTMLGYVDPGTTTRIGVNLVRLVADGGVAVCAGSLVFGAFFAANRASGVLPPHGYAAVRLGGIAAWVWFAASAAMIPFELANAAGQPVGSVLSGTAILGLLDALTSPKAWVVTSLLALLVAVSCRFVLRWRPTVLLALLASAGVLPPAVVGHSSSNGGHDVATNSIVFHVVAATLWLGVLVAFVAHVRRGGGHLAALAQRYERFALACGLVLALSGVADALVLVPASSLLNTGYGLLVIAKVGCLLVLAAVGVVARHRSVRSLADGRGTVALARLLGVELGLMLTTVGVSMGMAHVPPPNVLDRDVSAVAVLLGYDLDQPPTLLRLLTEWRFDVVLGSLAVLLAAGYLFGVWRLRRRGERWPTRNVASWLAGCATVLIATSSGLGVYASGVFSLHMAMHMLLDMVAPLLLVLGMPVTLALRALHPASEHGLAGPREWLLAVLRSPLLRALAHPLMASLLFVSALYLLYFTELFQMSMELHWAHEAVKVSFLLIGYLYCWSILGADSPPREWPHMIRLGLVFVMMPFDALFGIAVLTRDTLIAENFYRTLGLPWASDLLADQTAGGIVAWVGGELPMMALLLIVAWQWYQQDQRPSTALGSEEERAYETMLAELARSRRS